MATSSTRTADARRNAWIRRDHADLIARTKKHPTLSFQTTLDDFIADALRAVGMLVDETPDEVEHA